MRIECPFCGSRDYAEFTFKKAEADGRKLLGGDPMSDAEAYYQIENPADFHQELWRHSGGCGTWLIVRRHPATNQIENVVPAFEGVMK